MSTPRRLLIAGLGNFSHPLTRHSIGQLLLKNLAAKAASLPSAAGSPTLLLNKSHPAYLTTITLEPPPSSTSLPPLQLLFCLPRQLMNISGPSILSSVSAFLPAPYSTYRILTLQDDLDLPPSSYKVQRGGSPRGHNGVRSLERSLGTRDFWRVRVGVGRPDRKSEVASWVMGPLGRDEVRACEWEDGKGGELVEKVWEEILRIGYAPEEDED